MDNLIMDMSRFESVEKLATSLIVTSSGHLSNAPEHEMTRKRPHDALLIWLVSGRGYAETKDAEAEVKTGDLLIFEPFEPQYYRSDPQEPWEIFWVHFTGRLNRLYVDALRCYARPFTHLGLDTSVREQFDDLIIRMSERQDFVSRSNPKPDLLSGHLLASLLGRMLHLLQTDHVRVDDTNSRLEITMICRYINHHLAEPLSLDELAQVADLSVTHFSRLFRQQLGVSPMHYVMQQRMARAATMLVETRASVKQIAFSVGYEDPYHFSRLFKKHVGVSPVAWREQSRISVMK